LYRGKLHISPGFVFVLGLLFYGGLGRIVTAAMLAGLFHELCHLLALRLCRKEIYCIRVEVLGARICTAPLSERQECVCAVAGPAGNLLLTACFFYTNPSFAGLNLAMAVCNLMPLYPLDGGRLLRAFLMMKLPASVAARAVRRCSVFVSLAVMFCVCCRCVRQQTGLAGMICTAAVLIKLSAAADREAC